MSVFVVTIFSVSAEDNDNNTSGTTGDCTWKIENGVLTISGNGKMGVGDVDSSFGGSPDPIDSPNITHPWHDKEITKVIVEDGVTNIARLSFRKLYNLQSVSIGSTVKSIERDAFLYCRKLKSIIIPNSISSIGVGAFYECESQEKDNNQKKKNVKTVNVKVK